MFKLKCSIQLLCNILKHKYYVYKYGVKLKVPRFRLLKHDISKFHLIEFAGYREEFYIKNTGTQAFESAWEHHTDYNEHHIEFYEKKYVNATVYYPDEDIVAEMVADWAAASKVYSKDFSPKAWVWLDKNYFGVSKKLGIRSKFYLLNSLFLLGVPIDYYLDETFQSVKEVKHE